MKYTLRNFLVRHKTALVAVCLVFSFLLWAPSIYANLSTRSERYDLAKIDAIRVPERRVAIVLGAGLLEDNSPTPYLEGRVRAAVALYKAGRVKKMLMTGDNTRSDYNEPLAMKKLAERLGVAPDDITLDYAGLNTYDSCYRAKHIFKVNEATVISQGYHLPRAVMACDGLGINSIGVAALRKERDFTASYIIREWVSTDKIAVQLAFKPKPTALGAPEPIK